MMTAWIELWYAVQVIYDNSLDKLWYAVQVIYDDSLNKTLVCCLGNLS